ncbi:uncharacterized protein [Argopecten irradians]|uniref:uncharacterized protein n=1 Tax=Argopecten irradians TaxID=31199 RepID=UPI00371C4B3F
MEIEKEMKEMELREKEKDKERELRAKEIERELKEKEIERELKEKEIERELEKQKIQAETELRIKELELASQDGSRTMTRFVYLVVGILVLYLHDTSAAPKDTIDQSPVSIEQRITVLERTIHGLQTQNQQLVDFGRQVMFFAQLIHRLDNVAVEQVVVFVNVVTNVGNCFSGHTGVFTCCKSGAYFFSWIIDVYGSYRVNTQLMVNSSSIAINRAGDENYASTGSMSAVIDTGFSQNV